MGVRCTKFLARQLEVSKYPPVTELAEDSNDEIRELGLICKRLVRQYAWFGRGSRSHPALFDDHSARSRWSVVNGKETQWCYSEGNDPDAVESGRSYGSTVNGMAAGDSRTAVRNRHTG